MCATKIELRTQPPPQSTPKMTNKHHIAVRREGLGHTMQPNDLRKVQPRDLDGIISLSIWNEMTHFRKSIHHHHDRVFLSLCPREADNQVDTDILPRPFRHRRGVYNPALERCVFAIWHTRHRSKTLMTTLLIFGQKNRSLIGCSVLSRLKCPARAP